MTNNLFADYLLNEECDDIFDMNVSENASAFIAFFLHPLYKAKVDGQVEFMEVVGPRFASCHGILKQVSEGPSLTYDLNQKVNPGVIVWGEQYFMGAIENSWCENWVIDLLKEFQIKLYTRNAIYTFQIHTFREGFLRYKYAWEYCGWYDRCQRSHILSD